MLVNEFVRLSFINVAEGVKLGRNQGGLKGTNSIVRRKTIFHDKLVELSKLISWVKSESILASNISTLFIYVSRSYEEMDNMEKMWVCMLPQACCLFYTVSKGEQDTSFPPELSADREMRKHTGIESYILCGWLIQGCNTVLLYQLISYQYLI